MFAIGVRYLNGWAMATHPADRKRAEWPPHPDRLFMALAAAHYLERNVLPADKRRAEYEALRWLGELPERGLAGYPRLEVSGHEERTPIRSFVPVNDALDSKDNFSPSGPALPRRRAERRFPVAIPYDSIVYFVWEVEIPHEHERALEGLCRRVTYLGHSASLVQVWLERRSSFKKDPRRRLLVPVERKAARYRLRVTVSGRLEELEHRFDAGLRPTPSFWCGYDKPAAPKAHEPFQGTVWRPELIVLRRLQGPAFDLPTTLHLVRALRGAVLNACPEPVPEWVSGHTPDRRCTQMDHLACLPLPDVGFRYSDGHIMGLAIAVPQRISYEEQQRCLGGLLYDEYGMPRRIKLNMGRIGTWEVEVDERYTRPLGLRSELWTRAARFWATVTPIALDRHPKRGGDKWAQIEECIAQSCRRVGLPEPVQVIPSPVSVLKGAPHVRQMPNLVRRQDGGRVCHLHAVLVFDEPVCGPVLLGAGRFRGYGVCRPLPDGGEPCDA